MTGWLLDTNIVSELRKPRPEPKVVSFVTDQALDDLYVSEVTIAEVRFGIDLEADIARRAELGDWLAHKLRPMFERRVLPITEEVLLKWLLLVWEGRKTGQTLSHPDALIAATALNHGLTVVTRNTGDYRMARAPVFNPWTDSAPQE